MSIKSTIQKFVIEQGIAILQTLVNPELLREAVDKALDHIEEVVQKSDNTYDDKVILPVCKMIRETFNIPDNDKPA